MPPPATESMYDRSIREYRHYSAKYGPNTAIFLLVGSFYELYDYQDPLTGDTHTSMKRAVEILGIQCKVKKGEGPKGTDALFAGFPDTQLHKFAALLTRDNWTVIVIDQVKNMAGRVLERSVARILSPATHVEAVGGADALYLGGLWLEPAAAWTGPPAPPKFAAAALDLTTGAIHTFEGAAGGRADAWTADDLLHFFQVHPPKELVVWWRGQAIDRPEEGFLRRTLGVPAALLHVAAAAAGAPDALDKPLVREDLLRRAFQPKTLLPLREALGLAAAPLTEQCLCRLLTFVEDHFPSAVGNLHPPTPWNPRSAVFLGNHALTQLNMVCSREEDSVLGLFLRTLTPMGRRAMRRRLLHPICDAVELERRYEEVTYAGGAGETPQTLLRQILDLGKLHRRVSTALVNPADVLALDMSYACCVRAGAALAGSVLGKSPQLREGVAALLERFAAVFDVEKARAAGAAAEDLFCLTAAAGPKCSALEAEIAAAQEALNSTYEALVDWLGETRETLRLEAKEASIILCGGRGLMQRAEKKFAAGGAPTSFGGTQIHAKKSTSSMEVPALNALFHKILRLRENLAAAAREELRPVCDRMAEDFGPVWDALEEWVARVDCSFTLARVAGERGFVRPRLKACGRGGPAAAGLKATGLRHPLIEGQQTRTEYVRHAVSLGADADQQGWLVYGMNASGKSSLMKSVGIAVLLAQAGSFVPAEDFELAPFGSVFTRILNTDNLWAGLSSFAVEMTELREILGRADERSLVLGDEVCSGTESVSATALVGAALGWLTKRGARYMFATHLHGLQSLPAVSGLPGLRVWHLRVRYDAATDRLVYDRTLHPGAGSSLYGLEVAKAMALPLEVLEAAHAIRRELTGTVAAGDAAPSEWNARICRRACEVCGLGIVRDLEVHHIRPRAEARAGCRFEDGSNMNDVRNLIVVCQGCHDRHHAGELHIGPMKMTSDGPVREVGLVAPSPDPVELVTDSAGASASGSTRSAPPAPKKAVARASGGLSEEQLETVKDYLRKYPKMAAQRLIYDLEAEEGIQITVQRLRTIRGSI
jgi:DNA mismatch repair protein MutS